MVMKIELIRPDDLLHLKIEATNLRLDAANPQDPVLVVEDGQQPAYLAVIFPPQTIGEGAYFEYSIVKPSDGGNQDPKPSGKLRPDQDSSKTGNEPLDFPGQLDGSGTGKFPRLAVAQLGHSSRLVFKVPSDARIPYTLAGLLDWSQLELSVNPIAAIEPDPSAEQIAAAPDIAPPAANETAIELPYRLVISPNRETAWQHRLAPFTFHGRTELWHTRLALKTGQGVVELSDQQRAPLRAIWSDDYNPFDVPDPNKKDPVLARTAMSPNDRHQIVVLTSAFHGYEVEVEFNFLGLAGGGGAGGFARRLDAFKPVKFTLIEPYTPEPFEAEQLMLSPLGGWLRSSGHWNPPQTIKPLFRRRGDFGEIFRPLDLAGLGLEAGPVAAAAAQPQQIQLDLSEWVHIASQGRDHYVRIVYEGELWPFRHRAALIKVTERKFKEHNGIVGAYLMQRMFIVVREPVKYFALDDLQNPLKRVELTTLVTPDIADPGPPWNPVTRSGPIPGTYRSFWVEVMTSNTTRDLFKFHAVGADGGGNRVDFTVPLMFVSISDVKDAARMGAVSVEYNQPANIARRAANVPGQKVMFAKPDPAKPNDNTILVTQSLNYVVDAAGNPPKMLKAEVKIPQVQELLGSDDPTTIGYFDKYVANGFDAATGVFARIVKEDLSQFKPDNPLAAMVPATLGVTFSADKAGGFATPNLGVSTLTRALGPLAGQVEDAVSGTFDPKKFFPKNLALLFGAFDLGDLLNAVSLDQNAPKLRTATSDIPGGKLVTTTLDWEPAFLEPGKKLDLKVAAIEKDHGGVSELKIHGTIWKPVLLGGGAPAEVKSEFTGVLNAFRVSVLNSVFVNFTEFSFTTRSGQKPDVKVTLDPGQPVEFGGDLAFVEELRKAIPPDLFGKGPSLDIAPTGIRAGFAFALPPLSVGVFALKDVSLGALLELPFVDGKPVFNFNVSERQHPFLLTVSLFGGGGFFHLQIDTAGIKMLEASLEFGAAAAIDIGVASGEVHIMAGIYFSLQRKENTTDLAAVLSGFLRMGGSLSVLGLIKISVEFNLSFTYDGTRDKAYGRATLTVQVEVAFFSKSVELTVERAFGGSGDPTFGDLFSEPEMWSDYALAFG